MKKEDINKIINNHKNWLDGNGGDRANLRGANLQDADLQDADLQDADLQDADLQDANLRGANLQDANLRGANLQDANLRGADLRKANLRGADLRGANLDFSCWPLWCGSTNVKIDEKIARQLLYHAFAVASAFCKPTIEQVEFCNRFHRVKSGEVPKLN